MEGKKKEGQPGPKRGPCIDWMQETAECGFTTSKTGDPMHRAQLMLCAWTSQIQSSFWGEGGVAVRKAGREMLWESDPSIHYDLFKEKREWREKGKKEGEERKRKDRRTWYSESTMCQAICQTLVRSLFYLPSQSLSRACYPCFYGHGVKIEESFKNVFIYLAVPGLSCGTCSASFSRCMQDLVPWLGIEPRPHMLGTQSLSHWTTRKFSR